MSTLMCRHLVFASLLALGAVEAFAYVPPAEYVVRQVAKKRGSSLSSVKLRSQVVAMEKGQPTAFRFRMMTQVDFSQRKVRLRAYDDFGVELFATVREWAPLASKSSRSTGGFFVSWIDPRGDELVSLWKSMGIPIRVESELVSLPTEEERWAANTAVLDRFNGTPMWRIGGTKGDERSPQVWIEKDIFLPGRLIADTEAGRYEQRMLNYRLVKDGWYPRQIEIRELNEAHTKVLQEVIQDVWLNPEGNEMSRGFAGDGFTPEGENASAGVRDLITQAIAILR